MVDRVFCDLQIVCDDGDLWIHRAALEGWNIWWCSLLRDSTTNVVPGQSTEHQSRRVPYIPGMGVKTKEPPWPLGKKTHCDWGPVNSLYRSNATSFMWLACYCHAMTYTKFYEEMHFYKSVFY